LESDISINS